MASLLINLTSSLYFSFVSSWFRFLNYFRRRQLVDKPTDDLLMISAGEVAAMIRRGELTSTKLVDLYIKRIEHVNGMLNAVVASNYTGARDLAQAIDAYLQKLDKNSAEYLELADKKPLLGVPFTVKDTIFCKGFVCTAGVRARKVGAQPTDTDEAEAIKRLKEAGGILLALTNVPELGLWWETHNTVYGRTRNPWDTRRTAGGSTGGEGALLGAGATLLSLGTDCAGSLRIPAFFNGVFGLKPTPGIVPTSGCIPRVLYGQMEQMAVCGPMCRFAPDLSLMLKVLVGQEFARDTLHLDQRVEFRKTKVYYMEGLNSSLCPKVDDEMLVCLKNAVKYFEKKYEVPGVQVNFPLMHQAAQLWLMSIDESEYESLPRLMSNGRYDVNWITELIKYPLGFSHHTLPAIFASLSMPRLGTELQNKFDCKREKLQREVTRLLGDDGILLFPAFPTTAPFHNESLLTPLNLIYTAIWNVLGLPALSCPMGVKEEGNELPLGIQIVASPYCERLLLAAAQDLEEGFGGWIPPFKKSSLQLGIFSILE